MSEKDGFRCRIPLDLAGKRLDQALAELLPEYSRARLQHWIRTGAISVDGRVMRPRDAVLGGEWVSGQWQQVAAMPAVPQAIPLDIRFADADIVVVNKPAGLVVHPAVGNRDGTLVNALLHYAPELASLPRAGIVHRLDKETSGLLVVARSLRAHAALVQQLQTRSMGREYLALVNGVMTSGGTIDAPIGRHPVDRKRMAVTTGGKLALTYYRVQQRFRSHTLLNVKLATGRTHQIRVHMAHIRFPLVGDQVYGGRGRIANHAGSELRAQLQRFKRQALHAARLELNHPESGERLSWQVEPPSDLQRLIAVLAKELSE